MIYSIFWLLSSSNTVNPHVIHDSSRVGTLLVIAVFLDVHVSVTPSFLTPTEVLELLSYRIMSLVYLLIIFHFRAFSV